MGFKNNKSSTIVTGDHVLLHRDRNGVITPLGGMQNGSNDIYQLNPLVTPEINLGGVAGTLVESTAEAITLSANQNYSLYSKKYTGDGSDYPTIFIKGTGRTGGSTVYIDDCMFINTRMAILIKDVQNVVVKRSRFYNIGHGLMCQNVGKVVFEYNELEKIGSYPALSDPDSSGQYWAHGAVKVSSSPALENSRIAYNVVDNKNQSNVQTDGVHAQDYSEDCVSVINAGGASSADPLIICWNKSRGRLLAGSSSGGGIIVGDGEDGTIGNINIDDNIIDYWNQYGVGVAGGNNINVRRNRDWAPLEHDSNDAGLGILPHIDNDDDGQGYVVSMMLSEFGGTTPSGVLFQDNIGVRTRRAGWQANFNWLYNATSGVGTMDNNNFDWNNGTGPVPGHNAALLPEHLFTAESLGHNNNYMSVRRAAEV